MSSGLYKQAITISLYNVYYKILIPVSTCFASVAFAAYNDQHVAVYTISN